MLLYYPRAGSSPEGGRGWGSLLRAGPGGAAALRDALAGAGVTEDTWPVPGGVVREGKQVLNWAHVARRLGLVTLTPPCTDSRWGCWWGMREGREGGGCPCGMERRGCRPVASVQCAYLPLRLLLNSPIETVICLSLSRYLSTPRPFFPSPSPKPADLWLRGLSVTTG